ncbi:MAG: 4,5-DOPA dioxygenase extradiol [Bacteroidia bacterium]|jgi:4,5-DOPA dioxygenase extradiol
MPLIGTTLKLKALHHITSSFETTDKMPALFIGHGSPMNAIEENTFSKEWKSIGKTLPKPTAILCISAHWETKGTFVTAMEHPRTIHDFGGFPQALFDVEYPAPGSPTLVNTIVDSIPSPKLHLDQDTWGLDHGTWSILKHLYPDASIPVVQLSIDCTKDLNYHYSLAKELASLRDQGVLILGSGNMVHNLEKIAWSKINEENYGYDWAIEANSKMKALIEENDHKSLIDFTNHGEAFTLAIPTTEHYIPLIYTLGLSSKDETKTFFNDSAIGGSITMTSVKIGMPET